MRTTRFYVDKFGMGGKRAFPEDQYVQMLNTEWKNSKRRPERASRKKASHALSRGRPHR